MDALRELVLPRLDRVKKSGSGFMARCPVHEDGTASLSVAAGREHPVVLNCHAGCSGEDILAAMSLTWADLSTTRVDSDHRPAVGEWTPAGTATAVYDYRDETGALLFQVLRTADKQFRQRRPDPTAKTGWAWKLDETRRVLYRLPEIIRTVQEGRMVYICEGERDVHTIVDAGLQATCNPGGAGKWRPEYSEHLREAVVIIVADRDQPGQAHARQVRDALKGVAASVTIVEAVDGKDVTDHVKAGYGLEALVTIWTDEAPPKPDLAPDLWEFLATDDPPYDWIIPDLLERGDRVILTGFEGLGKALAVDTPIPTPKGWTTMGQLSVGDEVFGPDGVPARIVAATEVMEDRPCYRVQFSDGAEIVADAQHMWVTETLPTREATARQARRPAVTAARGTDQRHLRVHHPAIVTTKDIASTLHARGGHTLNHSIQVAEPLQYPAQELSIPPYVLGAWLGDGSSRFAEITSADPEIVDQIRACGEPIRKTSAVYGWRLTDGVRNSAATTSVQARLRALGLLQNKHIPESYQRASVGQRLELLRGLMDTDGTVLEQARGSVICEFSVCNERLSYDVLELLQGLGIKVTIRSGPAKIGGRTVGTRWRLAFQTELPVFHLPRKLERLRPLRTRRAKLRYITAVEPIDSVPVRCIQVDRADGMFVAGRECIPTHNSMLGRQLAVAIAAGIHPFLIHRQVEAHRVLIIDCENSERQSRRRFRPLAEVSVRHGHRVPDGNLRIIHRSAGIDLTRDEDAEWLRERVMAHKPDVLFVGPFYRLHNANINDEMPARKTVAILDEVRVAVDCAMIIEAHAGHGEAGKGRSVRPAGSSLLMRWPEFGFGIAPAKEPVAGQPCTEVLVKHWRGQRDERNWPAALKWGDPGDWPWKPSLAAANQIGNAA